MKADNENRGSVAMNEGPAARETGPKEAKAPQKYRKILRRGLIFVLCSVLCIVLVLGAALAFVQTQSGRLYLKDKLNALLAPAGIVITDLAGSIPLATRISLQMHDAKGTWLELKDFALDLDLGSIGTVLGVAVSAQSGHLSRLPEAGEDREEAGQANEGQQDVDIQQSIASIASATEGIPSWVPGIQLKTMAVSSFVVDRSVFDSSWLSREQETYAKDEACALNIQLKANAAVLPDKKAQWHNPELAAGIDIAILPVLAVQPETPAASEPSEKVPAESGRAENVPGDVSGKSSGSGSSDKDLPVCQILPDLRLDKFSLRLSLKGSLKDPQLDLESGTGTLASAGIAMQNPHVFASVPGDWLPALLASRSAPLTIGASALLQDKPLSCTVSIQTAFAGKAPQFTVVPEAKGPGFSLAGNVAFALKPSLFEAKDKEPALSETASEQEVLPLPLSEMEGALNLTVSDFSLLTLLEPGMKAAGNLVLDVHVAHDDAMHEITATAKVQDLAYMPDGTNTAGVRELTLASRMHNLDFATGIDVTKILASLSLKARDLHAGGLAPVSLDLSSDYSYEKGTLRLKTDGGIKGQIALDASAKEKTVSLNTIKIRVPARSCGLELQKAAVIRFADKGLLPVTVPQCSVRLEPSGQIQAAFSYDPQKLQGTLNIANLDTGVWQKVVPSLPKALINAKASLAGDLDNPSGSLSLTIKDLAIPAQKGLAVSSSLTTRIASSAEGCRIQNTVKLDDKTRKALGLSLFSCESSLLIPRAGGKLDFSALQKAPVQANLACKGAVAPLWKLAAQSGRRLDGELSVQASAKGTLASPTVQADLKLARGSFTDMELGAQVRDIALSARAQCHEKPESAKVDLDLSLTDGRKEKGLVTARGTIHPYTMTIPGITAVVRDFSPLRRRDIKAAISGDIKVSGKLASPRITGQLAVTKGSILIEELTLPASSVTTLNLVEGPKENVLRLRAEKKKQNAGRQLSLPGSISLGITVSRLFVEGYGLDTEWKADLMASGPLDAVGLTGDVQAVRGKLSLLSRTFTMDEGRVSFAGGTEPFLNLKMTTSANAVDASVLLEGSLAKISKIKPRFESTPSMPEDDILAYLLFGKPASELSQFEMLQLAQNVAVLAAFGTGSGTRSAIKNVTGLDVVNISQDKSGNASFELGKYLFDNVYAGVQKNSDSGSETSAIVRWELNKNSNAEITTGGTNTNVGVKWKMDY